ncbi:MAG: hypothetical protein UZ12_BCD005002628 [Bacteroidetes bacterium OLB12]|nr:MAG: hypothetical protein UZ12_BCD005002628 [Bacteroidetes bacterium OLB12]HNR75090.1 hypothetical protein [Cyclobacteriaceae bacterium]HNU43192.1 hypothetical protein [Cyclobacteriaceae bacterium]
MKNLIVILCLCLPGLTYSQNQPDSLYIVTYTTGPAWDVNKQPNEQQWFKEHSANLSTLRKEGIIKAGARYADKGIIVVTAKTLNSAKQIIFADAAIVNKLFVADVQKLNVFYEGCLERPK